MKTRCAAVLAVIVLLSSRLGARQGSASVTAEDRLASLSWMQGIWRGRNGDSLYETCTTSPDAGMILSASKEISGGRVTFFDFERFDTKGGDVWLTPYPAGRSSVSFKLVGHDPKIEKAVFENPEHDFPKRFTYERVGSDRLRIVLEGDEKGKPTTAVFDLERRK